MVLMDLTLSSLHAKETEEALQDLGSDLNGLSSEEAQVRLQKFGPNELVERKRTSPFQIFLNQFKDIFVIMLLIAIVLSVLIGWYKSAAVSRNGSLEEYIDAITIGAIVILNAFVGFVQEYRSEKAIEAMKRLAAPQARLLRDGKEAFAAARDVVPGDIILLETGDRIPADARLVEAIELKTDEAALTGESSSVDKETRAIDESTSLADRRNMVYMGTHITYGRGKAVVAVTGMQTEFGKIAEIVQTVEEEETPLKKKLDYFARKLGKLILVLVGIVFVLEILRRGTNPETVADMFLTSVALAVSAVPEGLPAVVTITLALGARELAKRNAVIRRLASAETLGAVTVICTDKTGTLTKGEMTARKIYAGNRLIDITGVGYEPKGQFLLDGKPIEPAGHDELQLVLKAAALCNNAKFDGKGIIGDTTEGALVIAALKAGISQERLEKEQPRVHEITFTSERKRMTTVHKLPDGKLIAYSKGAPEVILELCTRIAVDGKKKKLDKEKKKEILALNEKMASGALRVLAVAFKELPIEARDEFKEENTEGNLVFIGLAAMIDPPREEAKVAVRKCEQAGIKTVMITGDHKLTAVAVAKELGILKSGMVLTGTELSSISDEDFEKIVENVSVYARVSPEHKLRIVKALKEKGQLVAMTGDGVNDAPALKQSDIGVAMGITGTDVTKEASDIVLADDNFATIVNAIEGGRTIYDNIRKFSFFLIRGNFDELFVIGVFAIIGLELPLTASMILWINLVTDGGPAVALSMDPPSEDTMERPPRNPNEGVLHGRLASILATVVTQFLGTAVLFFIAYYVFGEPLEEARSLAFVQATLQELIVVWNCRSEKHNAFKVGFTSNKYLLLAVIISAAATIAVPYTGLFGTAPMTLMDWALVVPIAFSGFLILPEVFYGRKIWRWT